MASNVQNPFEGVLVDAKLWSNFDMSLERAIAKVQEPGAEDKAFAEIFGFVRVNTSTEVDASAQENDSADGTVCAHVSVSTSDDDSADDSIQTDKGKDGAVDKNESVTIFAETTAGTNKTRPFIEFPAEIHLKLFDMLCPVNSTVLGLTCKKFYKIHRTYHGTVSLMLRSSSLGNNQDGRRLGSRIRSFFDRKLHFNKRELGKYVTQKRAQALRDERWKSRDASVDTSRMSYLQRNRYLAGFQSDDSDWDEDE